MKKLLSLILIPFLAGCSEPNKTEVIDNYPNGQAKSTREYLNKDKNEYLIRDYFENGNLEFESKVVNGKFVEFKKSFYNNGNLEETVELTDSAKMDYCCPDGSYQVYYSNGQLKESHYKKDGLFNGLVTKYDSSGAKLADYQVDNDRKNGVARTFYTNGKVNSIKEYQNDTLVGIVYIFTETGDSLKRYNTYKAKMDFPIKYWKDNGNNLLGEYYNGDYYQVKWTWIDSLGNATKSEIADTVNGKFVTPDY
jgi:antitoxin component YwqK of YwqJK toxin-antitoxin module